jgi:coproporphyrinogen III oxidase
MGKKTEQVAERYAELQQKMCLAFEKADGKGLFQKHPWKKQLGTGVTCVMENGKIIEKAGLNFSHVHGDFTPGLERALGMKGKYFYATGISSIIHPFSPTLPIIHMNVRFFETDNGTLWFGGGIDLTPHYILPEEAAEFHRDIKKICDKYHPDFYTEFKDWADQYFYLPHRDETRGVGGIFFDRIDPVNYDLTFEDLLQFTERLCHLYPEVYTRFMERHRETTFTDKQKYWQNLRRGRYVEFNLICDRGTKFGLESDGNTESIFVSLPPMAQWTYNYQPEKGSEEEKTMKLLKKGIDWINR